MDDRHNSSIGTLGPYTRAVAVTPSDTDDLLFRSTALLATVAGTVNVRMQGTTATVALPIAAGIPLPVRVDRVLTGGSATGLFALD